ncbi:hypothetical protein T09_84 [Trichinella sp. T9]|nr:hypothetical protein T09_84 [Trichinella sp. T9]
MKLSTTKGVPLVKCNVQMLLESETFPGRFWKVPRQTNAYVSNKWPLSRHVPILTHRATAHVELR